MVATRGRILGKFQSGEGGGTGGAKQYSTSGDRPLTGNTAGDLAFVSDINKLYVWNSTGWYLVAEVTNANPTITGGVVSSYSLANDGTPTVITVAATEPEGEAITYSYAVTAGALGNIATVVQGTGANTNVFTITPSTNTAHSGSFSLTFTVSDPNNQSAAATSSFTLVFDVSGSYAFDGTGDYVSFADSYNLGTADWTVEFWCYFADLGVNRGICQLGKDNGSLGIMMLSSNKLRLLESGVAGVFDSAFTFSTKTWYHVAITNDDATNTQTMYINGTADSNTGSKSNAFTFTETTSILGGRWYSGGFQNPMKGWISNFRVVSSKVYSANFTAPTAPLQAIANTQLLAFTETDGSNITAGSTRFDGTNDNLSVSSTNIINSLANFTVEAWAFFDVDAPGDEQNIVEFNTGTRIIFGRRKDASGITAMYIYSAATSDLFTNNAAHDIIYNRWVHLAWVKEGQNLRMYIDGKNVAGNNNNSATNMAATPSASLITIGMNSDGNERMDGYISNLRISSTARYSADFARPSAAFTNDADTILLTCQNSTGAITDASSNGYSISANNGASANAYAVPPSPTDLGGNSLISTLHGDAKFDHVTPFEGPSGSVSFYGQNSGNITFSAINGNKTFTVEWWYYPRQVTQQYQSMWRGGEQIVMNYDQFFWWGNLSHQTAVTPLTWHHMATVGDGTDIYLYLDGVKSTNSISAVNLNCYQISRSDGENADGYMSNFRIVLNNALYTANFTPPTQPLTAITNTALLTCNDSHVINDESANGVVLTRTGETIATKFNPF